MWNHLFKKGDDCGCHTSLSPLYATVSSHLDPNNSARALVTMRGKVYVDSTDGLMGLMPTASYDLSYYLIYQALLVNPGVLYFVNKTDEAQFLAVYPEFRGKL